MTEAIKPIETLYKGYRFRSRLEARWAVFFDAVDIEWEYEPQGFEADSPQGMQRYLPDFKLPKLEMWAEIKGSDAMLLEDRYRIGYVAPGMPYIENCVDADQTFARNGLLLLGPIPEEGWGPVLHPFLCLNQLIAKNADYVTDALEIRRAYFLARAGGGGKAASIALLNQADPFTRMMAGAQARSLSGDNLWSSGWDLGERRIESKLWFPGIKDAYAAARQARFEHGETPGVGQ